MELKNIVEKNRSYRRFFQDKTVSCHLLEELVDMARVTASGRNAQPLKYALINEPERCAELYPMLAWAGYLKEWPGPEDGERPAAYVVMCNDTSLAEESKWDQGIAAQTIMLGAVERGLGGCMIASIRRDEISRMLSLPDRIVPVMVLALGVPKETVVMCGIENGDIRYYRDEQGVHYVPKRSLDEILINAN